MLPHVSWGLTILTPYAVLLIVFSFIRGTTGVDFYGKTYNLALESSVLGWGICVALFGATEARQILGPWALEAGSIVLVFEFFMIAMIVHIKGWQTFEDIGKARLSVLLTSLIFAINTALVTLIDTQNDWFWTIVSAVGAVLVPIVATLSLEWLVVKKKQSTQKLPPNFSDLPKN
jgi:hypothetical protein